MPPTLTELGIDRLTVDDRIALAVAIWDSLPVPQLLPPERQRHLEDRLSEHRRDPSNIIHWAEVAAEADERWGT